MNRTLIAATLVVASTWGRASRAQDAADSSTESPRPVRRGCPGALDADSVVRCALASSPEVRQAQAELDAAGGRRATAGVWLPSNPTVTAVASNRRRPAPEAASVLNWSVVLSQELEIAGQRSA